MRFLLIFIVFFWFLQDGGLGGRTCEHWNELLYFEVPVCEFADDLLNNIFP
jgi:hypothetical protein